MEKVGCRYNLPVTGLQNDDDIYNNKNNNNNNYATYFPKMPNHLNEDP